jgi:hypothetical protein
LISLEACRECSRRNEEGGSKYVLGLFHLSLFSWLMIRERARGFEKDA